MIEGHHYPYDHFRTFERNQRFYNGTWQRVFPERYSTEPNAPNIRSFSDGCDFLQAFVSGHIAGASKQECLTYLQLANQLMRAHFRMAQSHNENIQIEIEDQWIDVVGKHTVDYMGADNWFDAFCMAVLTRDEESLIGTLGRYRAEDYIAESVEDLPMDYPFYKFLQGIYQPNTDLRPILQELVTLSDISYMPERRFPYVNSILMPFVGTILPILANERAEYEMDITTALNNHIEFYSNKRKSNIPEGWLAIPVCTAAALAYDKRGFTLPFSSPYVPEWLVYHDFD